MRPLIGRLVALACAGLPVSAQAASDATTQTYLDSTGNQSAMRAAFEEAAKRFVPHCTTVRAGDHRTTVYRPITLASDGRPSAGMFRESATLEGCGERMRINILAIAQRDAPIKRVALLPGTTISDPLVQRDALPFAFTGAQSAVPRDCHAVSIRNTEFTGYEARNLEGKMPWREIWTLDACQKPVRVEMIFKPDRDGTTVIARPYTR